MWYSIVPFTRWKRKINAFANKQKLGYPFLTSQNAFILKSERIKQYSIAPLLKTKFEYYETFSFNVFASLKTFLLELIVVCWPTVPQGELCEYMLQEYKERQDTVRRRKQVAFTLPATMTALDHGFPIVNIRTGHNGTVVSVREDGLVCHWSPELQPLNTKDIFVRFPSFTGASLTELMKALLLFSCQLFI